MEVQTKPIEYDIEEVEEDEDDEEDIEDDEFEEEEFDGDAAEVTVGRRSGRGLTLKTLLKEGVLQPGEGSMTINYLGNKFKGDLLVDGRIRSQETGKVFGTPSAWAIFCKKIVNPDKKSGCGWASVRYRGKKLDSFKNNWFRQKRLEEKEEEEIGKTLNVAVLTAEEDEDYSCDSEGVPVIQEIVEFETLGNRSLNHDMSTMVELASFQSIGKLQPFNITMSSSAMAVIDVHGHLCTSEVLGYLAGQWDVNNHNLIVSHAFPMKCSLNDRKSGRTCQKLIFEEMDQLKLSLVGWYHTHPTTPPLPTLRDVDLQLENEMKMKGYNDSSYTPVIGIIASPYQKSPIHTKGLPHLSGNATGYWVTPPPENKPLEYGRPFSMQFTVVKDAFIPKEALVHMDAVIKYHQGKSDSIVWTDIFQDKITYWSQLMKSLKGRVPKDHYPHLVEYLRRTIGNGLPDEESPVVIPLPATPDINLENRMPPPEIQDSKTPVKPPPKSPQFHTPLPPLFSHDPKPKEEKESIHTGDSFSDKSKQDDTKDANFGLSKWFAQQKFTQDVFSLPPHEREHPFATDILHRELATKPVIDVPSQWNTGLNLSGEPADYTKAPLPNFSFTLDPPPPYPGKEETPPDAPKDTTFN